LSQVPRNGINLRRKLKMREEETEKNRLDIFFFSSLNVLVKCEN
jgi:hypothetical protein